MRRSAAPLYRQHRGIIVGKAISFSRTTAFPVDELISEGHVVFCKAVPKYNPGKSKFSTYLTMLLNQRLFSHTVKSSKQIGFDHRLETRPNRFCTNSYEHEDDISTLERMGHKSISCDPVVERRAIFFSVLSTMTSDARKVVHIILDTPEKLLDESGFKPKKIRGKLMQLLKQQGWTAERVLNSFREIKETFC